MYLHVAYVHVMCGHGDGLAAGIGRGSYCVGGSGGRILAAAAGLHRGWAGLLSWRREAGMGAGWGEGGGLRTTAVGFCERGLLVYFGLRLGTGDWGLG